MTKKKIVTAILFMLFTFGGSYNTAFSQSDLAIGDWEIYLPYKTGRFVTQSEDKVYYATTVALISIDKQTLERREVSKIDGLHDVRISALSYDETTDKLIVAYNNTRLDIISGNTVTEVNDIIERSILGDKFIYDIHVNDGIAYMATGFGIVEYDLQQNEFGFFASTDFRINTIDTYLGQIYASTDEGLYTFDLNSSENPSNFNFWEFQGTDVGLDSTYTALESIELNDITYLITEDRLYHTTPADTFEQVDIAAFDFRFIFEVDEKVGLGVETSDSNVELYLYDPITSTIEAMPSNCINNTNVVIQDQFGTLWVGDEFNDIRFIQNGNCNRIEGDGPRSTNMSDLEIVDDTLYIASGGAADNFTYTFDRSGFYQFANGEWTNFNEFNTQVIADSSLLNFYTITKNPITSNVMAGTYWNGILEFNTSLRDGIVYNKHTDSSLEGAIGDEARTRITDLVYDDDDNLWVLNYAAANALNVLTAEGNWHSFNLGNNTFVSNLVIDDLGYKWMTLAGNNGGVLVYDDGGTIADPTDDRFFELNQSNTLLESGVIYSVHKDDDGDIWVGSELGPVVFRCGSNIFEGECEGATRKVDQDGDLAALLATESIRTINTDGGNQKWFGTTNGVFVQSADGLTRKHHYTSENSPLLDNTIIDLAYDGRSGIMYIATNSGLNAIKTESTAASFSHSGSATVFPNPVRPDYEGPIAIKGLAKNANIKITDINGNLVHEGESIGGQAIWDGFDYNGTKASTGIYLVFSSTTDQFRDQDTFVSRIVFIK